LNLISEVFDLDDTCIKYFFLNLWLGYRGDEGRYRGKVAIGFINLRKIMATDR
jgi:hypothetical protein